MHLGYVCDNCGKKIMEEPDESNKDNPDWKPEIRGEIRIRIINAPGGLRDPLLMDTCAKCTRQYIKTLRKPLED